VGFIEAHHHRAFSRQEHGAAQARASMHLRRHLPAISVAWSPSPSEFFRIREADIVPQ
jgi:hypothetical protein